MLSKWLRNIVSRYNLFSIPFTAVQIIVQILPYPSVLNIVARIHPDYFDPVWNPIWSQWWLAHLKGIFWLSRHPVASVLTVLSINHHSFLLVWRIYISNRLVVGYHKLSKKVTLVLRSLYNLSGRPSFTLSPAILSPCRTNCTCWLPLFRKIFFA